jgi:Holliday junction resolvasome RuvABC endonuclease subunit
LKTVSGPASKRRRRLVAAPGRLLRKEPVNVSIDAGLNGCGLSAWSLREWLESCPPIACRNIYARSGEWYERAYELVAKVLEFLSEYAPETVFIEYPEFMPDSVKGYTAAAKGDLLKLTFLVGALAQALQAAGYRVVLVPVHVWKGQLSKKIVEARIKREIPEVVKLNPKSHSWDSIGIGLYAKGKVFNAGR